MITNGNFYTDNSTSFGMSVKFNNNAGKKFFNKVFENNSNLGQEYIKRQMNNKSSDIFVKNSDVYVGINAKKWKVIGSIWTDKKNGKSIEELICARKGNVFHKSALKTVIMEDGILLKDMVKEENVLLLQKKLLIIKNMCLKIRNRI